MSRIHREGKGRHVAKRAAPAPNAAGTIPLNARTVTLPDDAPWWDYCLLKVQRNCAENGRRRRRTCRRGSIAARSRKSEAHAALREHDNRLRTLRAFHRNWKKTIRASRSRLRTAIAFASASNAWGIVFATSTKRNTAH